MRVSREKPLGAEKRTNKLSPLLTPEGEEEERSHHCANPVPLVSLHNKMIRNMLGDFSLLTDRKGTVQIDDKSHE